MPVPLHLFGHLRLCFEIPENWFKQILVQEAVQEKTAQDIEERWIWLWAGTLAFLWISLSAVVAYTTLSRSSSWLSLVFAPVTITFAYSMRREPKLTYIPQEHKLPLLAGWGCLIIELIMGACAYFTGNVPPTYAGFITLYCIALLFLAMAGWIGTQVSKSMAETGEIDAIAWLLKVKPSQDPASNDSRWASLDSIAEPYRPRLLKSLMPLLSSLITSHNIEDYSESATKNLLIYVSCLAKMSDFKNEEGNFWRLWEDAASHPKLEENLCDRLEELAELSDHSNLSNAARAILNFYRQDNQKGNVKTTSAVLSKLWNAVKFVKLWNTVKVMMNSYRRGSYANVEQAVEIT